MATRLSTADILAAARAADGRSSDAAQAGRPTKSATPAPSPSRQTSSVSPPASVPPVAGPDPPAMSASLREVKGEREEELQTVAGPPSVRRMLEAVQGGDDGPHRPASMAAILGEVRRLCGTADRARTPGLAANSPSVEPGKQGRDGQAPSSTAASRRSGGSTADILAAARRQGAARSTASTSAAAQHREPGSASKEAKPLRAVLVNAPRDDSKPQPASMADVLSRVRSEVRQIEADRKYPPLPEMVTALRHADQRNTSRAAGRRESQDWISRMKHWFSETP